MVSEQAKEEAKKRFKHSFIRLSEGLFKYKDAEYDFIDFCAKRTANGDNLKYCNLQDDEIFILELDAIVSFALKLKLALTEGVENKNV